jgi:DNA-binding LacI/PurR family transcriptional regulator
MASRSMPSCQKARCYNEWLHISTRVWASMATKRSTRTPVSKGRRVVTIPSRHGYGVTILDIARELDISHTTVSRAMAGHKHISDETKARVSLAAKRMGYVPHASARTMRGKPSSVVGLVIPDIRNDFYASIAKIVAETVAAESMQLMLSVTEDDPDREEKELRAMLQARPAGVIIVATAAPRRETLTMLGEVAYVELIRSHAKAATNAVLIDDSAGISAAARHLLSYGHRRIAYIGGSTDLSTGRERLAGFKATLAEMKVRPTEIALGPPRPDFARHAVALMMARKDRPTGLVFGSSELTLGALQGLRARNLEWPKDVSIVGYHDPAWFELIGAGITTLRLPVQEIAQTATRVLLKRITNENGAQSAATRHTAMRFSPILVLRGSTRTVSSKHDRHKPAPPPVAIASLERADRPPAIERGPRGNPDAH